MSGHRPLAEPAARPHGRYRMKRLLLVALLALGLAGSAFAATAPLSTVQIGDRTCLHVENPDGALTSRTIIEWTIIDPSGAAYIDPNFLAGSIFYSGQPYLNWACIDNATLAAAGTGWTATVKISRAKSAGGTTTLVFF